MRVNCNVACEKGADIKVCINSVTFVSKEYSDVCGVLLGHRSAHLIGFQLYLCFLRTGNVQQMENANW